MTPTLIHTRDAYGTEIVINPALVTIAEPWDEGVDFHGTRVVYGDARGQVSRVLDMPFVAWVRACASQIATTYLAPVGEPVDA